MDIPAGACDTHFHILDTAYPSVPNPSVAHFKASVEDYRAAIEPIGTTRGVIVQPSLYGTDNRCTLAALGSYGSQARAVVVIDDEISSGTLSEWHRLGARGVRFNQIQKGATTMEMLRATSARIADLGWHVQLHMRAEEIAENETLLSALPCPLVLDHFGRIAMPFDPAGRGFAAIRRLLAQGRTYVKLSGPYHESKSGPPAYADIVVLWQSYVALAEDRMLWGSDWPHVTETVPPQRIDLIGALRASVTNEAQFRKILVDNPARLYGF